MIKMLKGFVAVAACVLSVNSFAGLITDVIEVDHKVGYFGSYTWTHNILDNGFTLGTAESASIEIQLFDDANDLRFEGLEKALIVIGFVDLQDGVASVQAIETWNGQLGVSSLAKLNADGTLSVTVQSLWGDFWVGNSTLNVIAKDVSVPESSSLMLFGLGLLGLGLMRRKARA